MTIVKTVLQAVTIVVSELLVTAIFVVFVVPMLVLGVKHGDPGTMKAVELGAACWVTFTSPFYWPLVIAVVTLVVWLFRR